MINIVEYNDGESRLQGHVEVLPSEDKDGTYVVTSYLEDKMYGIPYRKVPPENLDRITKVQQSGLLKELKKMAEGFKIKSAFDKLKDKGYFAQ